MLIPSILASIHHVLVFAIVAILTMELMLVRQGMTARDVQRVARIDGLFGLGFIVLIAVGIARVFFGDKGYEFYIYGWLFWLKMAVLFVAFLFSLPPTLRFIGWRRQAGTGDGFVPAAGDIAGIRRWMHREAAALAVIPVIAAFMARGY